MTVVVVVLVVVVALLTVLVLGLLRAYAAVLARLHDLETAGAPPAAAAPAFRMAADVPGPLPAVEGRDEWAPAHDLVGVDGRGDPVSIRVVGTDHDTVLLFLSSSCAGCAPFWDDLADPRRWPLAGRARLVVVGRDGDEDDPVALRALCPPGVDMVLSAAAWRDHEVPGSPYVLVVNGRTGRVSGAGSGVSLQQVTGLVERAVGATPAAASVSAPVTTTSGPITSVAPGPLHTRPASGLDREEDVDRALLAAGIAPGHASLWADTPPTGGDR